MGHDYADRRPPGPALPPVHFIYFPRGPLELNRFGLYAASFIVAISAAFVLQLVFGVLLGVLAAAVPAVADVLFLMQDNRLDSLPFDWLFIIIGVTFATYTVGIFFAVKLLHKRTAVSVLTERRSFDLGRFVAGFALYGVLVLVPIALFVMNESDTIVWSFEPGLFLTLLAFAVPALLVQTSAEEIFFRGYLAQALGALRLPLTLVVLIPSALFALAHTGNPEFLNDPSVIGFYFGFGVFMALVTVEDGGLELAIGAHFANNLITASVLRTDDSVLQTPSIFVVPTSALEGGGSALGAVFAPLVFWAVVLVWRRMARSG